MPKTKVVKNGRSTIWVEAHAETLFTNTGDITRWTRIFTNRIEAFTREFAPGNSRPRWAHYGPRLRSTFDGAVHPYPYGLSVGAAVGSSADHALYVDQGTGVYAGRSPYRAKILPPWHRGSPSLYESTWRPGNRARVRQVWIKGQKGQHFFERGLERAFQSMRMRSFQLPDDPRVTPAQVMAAQKLMGFLGRFQSSSAFVGELEQWRAWRDAKWSSGGDLGPTGRVRGRRSLSRRAEKPRARLSKPRRRKDPAEVRENAARRAKEYRARQKAKGVKPDRSKGKARARDQLAFLAAMRKKYGSKNVDDIALYKNGYWYVNVRVMGDDGKWSWVERRGKAKT